MSLTLVLGGGGSAAVAWNVGVLTGLADESVELTGLAHLVGTSAGAIVATHLAGAIDATELGRLYEGMTRPVRQRPVTVDFPALMARLFQLGAGASDPSEGRRLIGEFALTADTMPVADRHAELAPRVGRPDWPGSPELHITAVDAGTGEFVTFTRESGVELVDAVVASCAVPGVWPPAVVGDRRYVDGAVRSATNAFVRTGSDRVLVLAPLSPPGGVERELGRLEPAPRAVVVAADAESGRAFGTNPLDPAVSGPSAAAGRRQGRAAADQVRRLLSADDDNRGT